MDRTPTGKLAQISFTSQYTSDKFYVAIHFRLFLRRNTPRGRGPDHCIVQKLSVDTEVLDEQVAVRNLMGLAYVIARPC
jgi:hypothetical protein